MRPMLNRINPRGAMALATACVAVLAFAEPSTAHRTPTKSEAKAIRSAVIRACENLGDDLRCRGSKGIRVSTANRRYAMGSPRAIRSLSATGGAPVHYHVGLRKSRGRWRVVWEEVNDLNVLTCAEYRKHFPKAVIRDFRLHGFPGRWGAAPPVPCWTQHAGKRCKGLRLTSPLRVWRVGCRLARKVARKALVIAEIGGGGGRWGVEGQVWRCIGDTTKPIRIKCYLEGRPKWKIRYTVHVD